MLSFDQYFPFAKLNCFNPAIIDLLIILLHLLQVDRTFSPLNISGNFPSNSGLLALFNVF